MLVMQVHSRFQHLTVHKEIVKDMLENQCVNKAFFSTCEQSIVKDVASAEEPHKTLKTSKMPIQNKWKLTKYERNQHKQSHISRRNEELSSMNRVSLYCKTNGYCPKRYIVDYKFHARISAIMESSCRNKNKDIYIYIYKRQAKLAFTLDKGRTH